MRIGLRLASNWQSNVFRRVMPLLERRGCEFVNYGEGIATSGVDLWIVQQLCLEDAMAHGMGRLLVEIEPLQPMILMERLDGANLTGITRRLLASEKPPQFVWKNSRYADPWLYNKFSGRYHVELIKQSFGEPNWIDAKWEARAALPMQIPADRLGRIHAPFSFGSHVKQTAVLAYGDEGANNADRPIDVMFAGTVKYGDSAIQKHRHACCDALENMPNYGRHIGRGRVHEYAEYLDLLFGSKCVVVPVGYGEETYRLYEGIFAGCQIITSCLDHIADAPVAFRCKPDWSDLEDKVRMAVETWDKPYDTRLAQRLDYAARCNDAAVADRLFADIQAAVNSRRGQN